MSHNLSSEMKVNSILTLQKNPFTKHSNEEKNNTNTDHGYWTELASRMRCKSCLLLFFLIVISKSLTEELAMTRKVMRTMQFNSSPSSIMQLYNGCLFSTK